MHRFLTFTGYFLATEAFFAFFPSGVSAEVTGPEISIGFSWGILTLDLITIPVADIVGWVAGRDYDRVGYGTLSTRNSTSHYWVSAAHASYSESAAPNFTVKFTKNGSSPNRVGKYLNNFGVKFLLTCKSALSAADILHL